CRCCFLPISFVGKRLPTNRFAAFAFGASKTSRSCFDRHGWALDSRMDKSRLYRRSTLPRACGGNLQTTGALWHLSRQQESFATISPAGREACGRRGGGVQTAVALSQPVAGRGTNFWLIFMSQNLAIARELQQQIAEAQNADSRFEKTVVEKHFLTPEPLSWEELQKAPDC